MKRVFIAIVTTTTIGFAGVLFAFSAWAVRDGWFPSEKVLQKHPDPSSGFYLFNKVMAIGTGLGLAFMLVVGMVVFLRIRRLRSDT